MTPYFKDNRLYVILKIDDVIVSQFFAHVKKIKFTPHEHLFHSWVKIETVLHCNL